MCWRWLEEPGNSQFCHEAVSAASDAHPAAGRGRQVCCPAKDGAGNVSYAIYGRQQMAVFAATRVSSRCCQCGLRRRALSGQAYCGIPQGLQHCRTGRQQPHLIFTQRRRIDDHAQVQPSPPPMQPPASSEHLPAASLAAVAATAATRSSRRRSSGPAIRRRMIPPIAWPPAAQVYRPAASGWSTRVSREPAGRAYPAAHAWHGNRVMTTQVVAVAPSSIQVLPRHVSDCRTEQVVATSKTGKCLDGGHIT